MDRIFDANDHFEMAEAAVSLSKLSFTAGRLNNVAISIATLDDPYYSRRGGRTYMAAARLASPSEILELAKLHDGWGH
jgi:hypothetical protein